MSADDTRKVDGPTQRLADASTGSASPTSAGQSVQTLEVGCTIAERYLVKEELGRGAQAKVYRVYDFELEEEIALKVLSPDATLGEDATQQFKNEIKLARRIVHPNVCRLYDFGRWGDVLFVTMELIEGKTLSDRIKEDSMGSFDARLTLFKDILVGLRAAHSVGIVHRDIKPQNIMVQPDDRAVIMDFGLAGEEQKAQKARGGTVLGTPAYIAPERLKGFPADPRSDIYSLGVVLDELSTGKKPFDGHVSEVIQKHLHEAPRPVSELVPDIPAAIEQTVMNMLTKKPEERFVTVDQILESLAEIRSTPVGRSVLLAEGDDDLRVLVEEVLMSHGLSVTSTNNGEKAIELLLRERPDAIVLDFEMPKIDGFRTTEILRNYHHLDEVPIYILSRVRDSSYLAYARQLGITKLIRRPFAVHAFAADVLAQLED